ncbi:GtrA family protein [Herbaspirillum aquaticum]|jgi:putative flippase GtrA|uniref:Polysaccharide biosynthesis protein GtrA n=1 Tax=Herbaspirillum aquaticum TaxID=568783 RepID=A0A225SUV9_9BURK|nr:GtrA family protein [Herbaspirillum aquaticum]OWY34446.1 polysaccharide biosynthesis protein GtrA [Herbaspirillum aquaticum]
MAERQAGGQQPARLRPMQFLVFALVGAVGTLAHYAVLLTLVECFRQPAVMATACGALVGALLNFVLNHRLTFASQEKYRRTILRFMLIAALSLVLNALLLQLLLHWTGWDYRIAQLIVTLLVLVLNYVLSALWAFAAPR